MTKNYNKKVFFSKCLYAQNHLCNDISEARMFFVNTLIYKTKHVDSRFFYVNQRLDNKYGLLNNAFCSKNLKIALSFISNPQSTTYLQM